MIVITHLINETFISCNSNQFFSFCTGKAERFFTKNMKSFFEGMFDHWVMKARWCSDYHKIQPLRSDHFFVVTIYSNCTEFLKCIQNH